MKKKSLNVLIVTIVFMVVLSFSVSVFAGNVTPKDIMDKADTTSTSAQSVTKLSGQILGIVQVIGVAVAVIMLIVLAIKYISAAPNDKAEIKKHAVVYIVGAICLFGAAGLLSIIQSFATTIGS